MKTSLVFTSLFLSSLCYSQSYLDIHKAQGWEYYREGNYLQARNSWFRYAELCQRACESSDMKDYSQIREKLEEMRPLFKKKEKTIVIEKKKKPKKKKRIVYSMNLASVPGLYEKAQVAEQGGQLEKAEYLYQLILDMDPSDKKAHQELKDIQERME